MIHPALKKTYVTQRYYAKSGIELDPDASRKRFAQDKHINEKILLKVLVEFSKEIKKIIKKT